MSNQLKNILKILNIPDVNFHVLRHTFATRCIENNFDIKALSEILGHSKRKYYAEPLCTHIFRTETQKHEKLNL